MWSLGEASGRWAAVAGVMPGPIGWLPQGAVAAQAPHPTVPGGTPASVQPSNQTPSSQQPSGQASDEITRMRELAERLILSQYSYQTAGTLGQAEAPAVEL